MPNKKWVTNGQTDLPTDRQTDRHPLHLMDDNSDRVDKIIIKHEHKVYFLLSRLNLIVNMCTILENCGKFYSFLINSLVFSWRLSSKS